MTTVRNSSVLRAVPLLITVFFLSLPAKAQYGGGTGKPDDPYQIATAEDLMLLGNSPEDYDKNFILTADIDLNPNLPGRKVFDKAVIDTFTGVFDGNGHTISHLTITGGSYHLGLFGWVQYGAKVKNLGLMDVNITGSGGYVGGLVGIICDGTVTQCYSTGMVSGEHCVGGLVGVNNGIVAQCYSTVAVTGSEYIGGLVGKNNEGVVYAYRGGIITRCYSNGVVGGESYVGGLVGENWGTVERCYSTATVSGNRYVGGFVGENVIFGWIDGSTTVGRVALCFWDTETSGQAISSGGKGKTTYEMQTADTFLEAGWDFLGEVENGLHEVWKMPEGGGYPSLAIFNGYSPPVLQGLGTPESPYVISNATELGAIVYYSASAHYRLAASIDLSGIYWGIVVIPSFAGTFDGGGHSISHLTIRGGSYLGLFAVLESGAEVRHLGVVDVNIAGSDNCVGGLVAYNQYSTVTQCYSSGVVRGGDYVGGLMGWNGSGEVSCSYSTAMVSGDDHVGGLVGVNSTLLGLDASITHCYSTGAVSSFATSWRGIPSVGGGLVSWYNDFYSGTVSASFWDTQTSGSDGSDGGIGLTTAEMQTAGTFFDAGWDFVDETENGTDDIWWIIEGQDYPRLWWELIEENFVVIFEN